MRMRGEGANGGMCPSFQDAQRELENGSYLSPTPLVSVLVHLLTARILEFMSVSLM